MTDYSQLVNKAGTIYNTSNSKGYTTPQELATDLGVDSNAIQWGNIAKNDAYSPTPPSQVQTPPTPAPTAQVTPAEQALKAAQATGPAPQNKAEASGALAAVTASPTFYKPTTQVAGYDPATVFDAQGKPLSYDQYLSSGGKADFSNVTSGAPPQMTQTQGIDNILKSSAVDQQLMNDPGYQQLLADRAEFNNVVNQQQSLTETYQQISTQLGIPAMNTELMNMKNVIEGSEDDIRTEVKAANGFATESQVLALSGARNKQLIKNYNNLLDTKQMAMETLSNMTNLASQDRQFAMNTLNQKLQIDQQIIQYRDKMVSAAKEAYANILNKFGAGGLVATLGSDPSSISLVEKTLGLNQGGLQQLASYESTLAPKEQVMQMMKDYADAGIMPTDTVAQATAKLKNSAIYKKQTYIAPTKTGTSGTITPVVDSMDAEVKQIILNNPGEYGNAADAIDARFGKGTATKYDSWLKDVYINKKDANILQPKTENLSEAQLIARAIIDGSQPPTLTGLYSKSSAVRAELAKQGYDLTNATQDWTATQKYLATLNGASQVRLRQAIQFAAESLPIVEDLSNQWNRGQYPVLNKAQLLAAKNGLLGQDAQNIATQLEAQIKDMQAELATVYKGGNTATDMGLQQAADMLNADWSAGQLQSAVNLIRKNLQVRINSISNAGVSGVGSNAYAPQFSTEQSTGDYESYLKLIEQ